MHHARIPTSPEAPPQTACGFAEGKLTSSPVRLLRFYLLKPFTHKILNGKTCQLMQFQK